jgi:hypothetical protein
MSRRSRASLRLDLVRARADALVWSGCGESGPAKACNSSSRHFERFRRRAIDAQYQVSRAIDEKVKEALLSRPSGWPRRPFLPPPVTQQQQQPIQPQAETA